MSDLISGFAADTALEPVGEGLWRGQVDPSWFVVAGPNGGFLAALATRAAQELSARPARSLTLHYLEAPVVGPIDVAATIERGGRTTAYLSLRISQHGRPVALGLAACAHPVDDQPAWHDAVMPDVPGPDECEAWDTKHPKSPPYLSKYDIRWAPMQREAKPARVLWWLRTKDAVPLDGVIAAALTDAAVPPAFLRMRERLFVPTIDLTIHWRSPLPEGERPWVLGHFVTRVAGGGACEEDGELWSQDGRLLVQSRQLAIVREPRG